jgi:hypothetical protein
MYLQAGPFHFGMPDEYARGKATEVPDEGGAVILVLVCRMRSFTGQPPSGFRLAKD